MKKVYCKDCKYWSNPNIIPPPKPKQKIKGELERWVSLYNVEGKIICGKCLFETEEGAKKYSLKELLAPVKITIPYEYED